MSHHEKRKNKKKQDKKKRSKAKVLARRKHLREEAKVKKLIEEMNTPIKLTPYRKPKEN